MIFLDISKRSSKKIFFFLLLLQNSLSLHPYYIFHMKKILLLSAILGLSFGQSPAASRSLQQAHRIASQLLDNPTQVSVGSSFSIYNNEQKPGFAIISHSDRMRPVIGYSDSGSIDPDNLPDNLRSWLLWVDEASLWLDAHPECQLSEAQLSSSAISPFMGNIAWSQNAPFSNKCPNSYPTGCVATAGAQCVYFYRYPSSGTGSHTNHFNAAQTVNFSKATYDYSLMFDHYSSASSYSSAQLNEVAELSYHVGVMADMNYGPEFSGASVISLRRGLVENLGYDPYCQIIYRSAHTFDEWQQYLSTELSASRPVIFSGACNNGQDGHCFIVDGRNANGLYHVNWGWGGQFNGYYDITVLNPEGTDTGASISDDGFCTDQSILVQLAPAGKVTNPHYYSPISAPQGVFNISTTSVALGKNVTFALSSVYNFTTDDVTGKFGFAFLQNGQIVKFFPYIHNAITYPGAAGGTISGNSLSSLQITLPTSLSSGTYQVYPCFIPSSGDFENECGIVYSKATSPSFYTCVISGGKATFSKGSLSADVSVSDWSFSSSSLYAGTEQAISCTLSNLDTDHSLVGKYYLYLSSPSGQSEFVEADDVLTLAPGAKGTLSFHTTFPTSGQWKAQLYIFYQNIDRDPSTGKKLISGTSTSFSVLPDASTKASFTLLAAPQLVASPNYGDSLFIQSPATFSLSLQNSGEAYTGSFQMQLFKSTTSTSVIGTITAQISIPAKAQGTYTFTGTLQQVASSFPAANSGTTYYAKPLFSYGGTYTEFPLSSGIKSYIPVKVYAGQPTSLLPPSSFLLPLSSSLLSPSSDLLGRPTSPKSSGLLIRNHRLILLK